MRKYKINFLSNSRGRNIRDDLDDIIDDIKKDTEEVYYFNRKEYSKEVVRAFRHTIDDLEITPSSKCSGTDYKYLKKVQLHNSRGHLLSYLMIVMYSEVTRTVYPLKLYHSSRDFDFSSIKIPDEIDKSILVEQKDLKLLDFLLMNWN